MKRASPFLVMLFAATACGQAGEHTANEDLRTFDVAAPDSPQAAQGRQASEGEPPAPGEIPASVPRIAYTYGYSFRLPGDAVPAAQERHLALCRELAAARCRVVNLERSGASGAYATATTTLQVAAADAVAFGARLIESANEAGAETVDRSITGEDLSRQMVDTQARIQTREALIRRLTVLLETRSGNIQQAVEAERAITTAQEELDAARGWLAEMRTRVDMSTFTLRYQSGAPLAGGLWDPVRRSFGEVGSGFANSLAALILFIGLLLPWLILGGIIFQIVRVVRRRRLRREALELEAPESQDAPDAIAETAPREDPPTT